MKLFTFNLSTVLALSINLLGASTLLIAADSIPVMRVNITNEAEDKVVDIIREGGIDKLHVIADINVVSTNTQGKDPNPDSWCRVDNAGAIDDTVTIDIPDDSCNVVTTLTATEAGDEIATVDLMVSNFNADGTCNVLYEAVRVKDNPVIVIAALKIDGIAERPDAGDFNCDATGTTTVTEGFDNIVSREKLVKIIPDPDDPRVGATNVTGSLALIPTSIDNRILQLLKDGSSSDMRVDGSTTPVDFIFPADATNLRFIGQIRCFGGGNGIRFGQFLSKAGSGGLTNGIEITIRSNGNTTVIPLIHTTEDWKNLFSFPSATDFKVDVQAGADQFIAILTPVLPFAIQPVGELSPLADDFIQARVQDDISSGLSALECLAAGFRAP